MRLATFNLQHGLGHPTNRVELDRLVEAVGSLDADVLALQEVDRFQPRSGEHDLARELADRLGSLAWHFQPVLLGAVGTDTLGVAVGGEPADTPAYGLAILTRYPAHDWQTLQLPRLPVRYPTRGPEGFARVPEEPRAALRVTLDSPVGRLTVVDTHLTFVVGSRTRQLRRLANAVRDVPGALALMGDFNIPAPWPSRVTGLTALADALTFPAEQPEKQIDHVLGRGLRAEPGSARAVHLDVSDHRALVVGVEAD